MTSLVDKKRSAVITVTMKELYHSLMHCLPWNTVRRFLGVHSSPLRTAPQGKWGLWQKKWDLFLQEAVSIASPCLPSPYFQKLS